LGHVVSRDGVQPDPEKIKAVEQWPIPKCSKELQQLLGLAYYYRRFSENIRPDNRAIPSSHRKGEAMELVRRVR
ncbi:Retrovirus-related Pol polyprotein from transposon 17.6, partial [Trichinella britovi]